MKDPLEIRKTLALSTGHVTLNVAHILDDCRPTPDGFDISWQTIEYGWLFRQTKLDPGDLENGGRCIPRCLRNCLELAAANGCDYLILDCDGPQIEQLPFYNW